MQAYIDNAVFSPKVKETLQSAMSFALQYQHREVTPLHLAAAMFANRDNHLPKHLPAHTASEARRHLINKLGKLVGYYEATPNPPCNQGLVDLLEDAKMMLKVSHHPSTSSRCVAVIVCKKKFENITY